MQRRTCAALLVCMLVLTACSLPQSAEQEPVQYDPGVELDPDAALSPDEVYSVTVAVPRLPLRYDNRSLQTIMSQLLASFRGKHHQVKLSLKVYPLPEFSTELSSLVEGSVDPVVALYAASSPQFVGEHRLLPVTPFIEPDVPDYWPVALDALRSKNEVWGWPTLLVPELLLASNRAVQSGLTDEYRQLGTGWSPEEFKLFLQSTGTEVPLGLLDTPIPLFSSLVVAAGGSWLPVDEAGRPLWTAAQVFQVAQLLAEMEQEALLSGPDSPRKGLLPGLQAGSTGAVVGANSWLIFQSRQNETAPLQLLPLPTGRTHPLTPVHTVSLAVYRGTKAQEPAHYRTANELARFLATEFSVWAAGAGMGVPATRAGLQDWADRAGTTHSGETSTSWYNTEAAVAWTLATGIPARPFCPHHQQQIDSYYSEVLGPALMLLLEGKLDPKEFVERTTEQ